MEKEPQIGQSLFCNIDNEILFLMFCFKCDLSLCFLGRYLFGLLWPQNLGWDLIRILSSRLLLPSLCGFSSRVTLSKISWRYGTDGSNWKARLWINLSSVKTWICFQWREETSSIKPGKICFWYQMVSRVCPHLHYHWINTVQQEVAQENQNSSAQLQLTSISTQIPLVIHRFCWRIVSLPL